MAGMGRKGCARNSCRSCLSFPLYVAGVWILNIYRYWTSSLGHQTLSISSQLEEENQDTGSQIIASDGKLESIYVHSCESHLATTRVSHARDFCHVMPVCAWLRDGVIKVFNSDGLSLLYRIAPFPYIASSPRVGVLFNAGKSIQVHARGEVPDANDDPLVEKFQGKSTENILKGLKRHTGILSAAEQKMILPRNGNNNELKAHTHYKHKKPMRGKCRVAIHFGFCIVYDMGNNVNTLDILRNGYVDPRPHLLKLSMKILVEWHVIPPYCVRVSCVVDRGDYMASRIYRCELADGERKLMALISAETNQNTCYRLAALPNYGALTCLQRPALLWPPFALVQGTLAAEGFTLNPILKEAAWLAINRWSVALIDSELEFRISMANSNDGKKTYIVLSSILPEEWFILSNKMSKFPLITSWNKLKLHDFDDHLTESETLISTTCEDENDWSVSWEQNSPIIASSSLKSHNGNDPLIEFEVLFALCKNEENRMALRNEVSRLAAIRSWSCLKLLKLHDNDDHLTESETLISTACEDENDWSVSWEQNSPIIASSSLKSHNGNDPLIEFEVLFALCKNEENRMALRNEVSRLATIRSWSCLKLLELEEAESQTLSSYDENFLVDLDEMSRLSAIRAWSSLRLVNLDDPDSDLSTSADKEYWLFPFIDKGTGIGNNFGTHKCRAGMELAWNKTHTNSTAMERSCGAAIEPRARRLSMILSPQIASKRKENIIETTRSLATSSELKPSRLKPKCTRPATFGASFFSAWSIATASELKPSQLKPKCTLPVTFGASFSSTRSLATVSELKPSQLKPKCARPATFGASFSS